MKKMNRLASLAALFLATAGTASMSLAADSFKLDSVHSGVVFTIHHLVSSPFGIFHAPEGTVTVDGGVPALDISVPVDKVDMGNAKWEEDIKAASWFDVKQFPKITFKTTSVKKLGEDPTTHEYNYEATGDLTLHGVTKSVTVTLTKTGEGKGMQGETRAGYSCTFKVKRSDYGMTTYVGPIGDEVTLMVNIEAIKQ
jgi:polyisoprenoid-binding protein YceI